MGFGGSYVAPGRPSARRLGWSARARHSRHLSVIGHRMLGHEDSWGRAGCSGEAHRNASGGLQIEADLGILGVQEYGRRDRSGDDHLAGAQDLAGRR